MKKIIYLLIIVMLSSCSLINFRNKELMISHATIKIEGQVISVQSKNSIKNARVKINIERAASDSVLIPGIMRETTTDENGNFTFDIVESCYVGYYELGKLYNDKIVDFSFPFVISHDRNETVVNKIVKAYISFGIKNGLEIPVNNVGTIEIE